jgi:hypothetical protein
MKKSEAFPSRFLSAPDLNGKPKALTIESAQQELLGNGTEEKKQRTVLYFKGERKGLPLNITNWNAVVDVTGEDDSDNWATHRIELYPTKTTMRGEIVDCVRVRAPQDTLPLEQPKQKAKAKPKPKPKPKALPPIEEDLDDSIPFN